MIISEQKIEIRNLLKKFSIIQKDIKYILNKYNNPKMFSSFDELKTINKEVITAIHFIYRNIYELHETREINGIKLCCKYIISDILYMYLKHLDLNSMEDFFNYLNNLTNYFLYFGVSFVSIGHNNTHSYKSKKTKYNNLKEMAFVIHRLNIRYPTSDSHFKKFENDENEFLNIYLRKEKLRNILE